jgi:hypothetical protein
VESETAIDDVFMAMFIVQQNTQPHVYQREAKKYGNHRLAIMFPYKFLTAIAIKNFKLFFIHF